MKRFQHQVKHATGQVGWYASLDLTVVPSAVVEGLHVEVDPVIQGDSYYQDYLASAQYGFLYAWAQVNWPSIRRSRGVGVVLHNLDVGHGVESPLMVMVMAAAEALWKGLGYGPSKRPRIDDLSSSVVFPR